MARTNCCNARTMAGEGDGGAWGETFCRVCDEQVCSECAGHHEAEGGYGDDGSGVRVYALCVACTKGGKSQ